MYEADDTDIQRAMIMTAHPCTIKEIIDIDLPRPRDISKIRTTLRYNELFQMIWQSLREEVRKDKEQKISGNHHFSCS